MIIGGGVPNPASGGGALTTYTIVRWLLDAGHRVTVFVLHDTVYYDPAGAEMASRVDHLHSLGAAVVPSRASAELFGVTRDVRSRVRRNVAPRLPELLPHAADAPALASAVAETDCDVAFVYHVEALAASQDLRIPRVAGLGDPPHLPPPTIGGARPSRRSTRLAWLRVSRRSAAHCLASRRGCSKSAPLTAPSLHITPLGSGRMALRAASTTGRLFRIPTRTASGAGGRPARLVCCSSGTSEASSPSTACGSLRGLACIERSLGREGFWVDVVGGYDPPRDLASLFEHPRVRRHPHSEGAVEWFRESDALLVPTSIPLGIRVRIISAFAAGRLWLHSGRTRSVRRSLRRRRERTRLGIRQRTRREG